MTIYDNSRHVRIKTKHWMREENWPLWFHLIDASPKAPVKTKILLIFLSLKISLGMSNPCEPKGPPISDRWSFKNNYHFKLELIWKLIKEPPPWRLNF